ncbi:MAG TPA: selenide, water dikinase SelD, partial [Sediminibacterium sp.]|nr:selenide, water dikinase SelD [Sediminibacterium sp.]
TKPSGTGILSTAQKRGVLQPEHTEDWYRQLTALNDAGLELGKLAAVHAMTDVTGFGLLGHLIEMANGSGLHAQLQYHAIPVLAAARTYLPQRIVPDATYRNWNAYQAATGFAKEVPVMEAFTLLPDPQTNGGLLIAADPAGREAVEAVLHKAGLAEFACPIGILEASGDKTVWVNP